MAHDHNGEEGDCRQTSMALQQKMRIHILSKRTSIHTQTHAHKQRNTHMHIHRDTEEEREKVRELQREIQLKMSFVKLHRQ